MKWTADVIPEPASATGATVRLVEAGSGERFDVLIRHRFEPARLCTDEDRVRLRQLAHDVAARIAG